MKNLCNTLLSWCEGKETKISYRPVHKTTLTNEVQYFPPTRESILMVQINLPKNSEVKKGIYYKDKTGSKNIRKVNVYRWDPSSGENPRLDSYEVDMDNCPSKVLDILNKIKNEIDPSLSL